MGGASISALALALAPPLISHLCCRNEVTAKMSKIKAEAYSVAAARQLLQTFQGAAGQALLFLKNIRTISIHVKGSAGGPVELLQKISLDTEVPTLACFA